MSISKILAAKGYNVFSVTSNATVFEALQLMGEKNIGALLVIDDEKLTGILSEKDYARKIILKGKNSHDSLVSEIMTPGPVTVSPDDNIDRCMELMSEKHIRHLPVVKNDKVVGMISIGDVVTQIITAQKETINHLHQYIHQ
jgi:CBS domain-containing protein